MKKVLIITYYWPPVGGSGVQRWLKMCRYLPDFGWEPVIFTPENPSFGAIDKSLEKDVSPETEVLRLPIWEPYQLFARLKGKRGSLSASDIRIKENKKILDKISLWIRGNFFIPDPRIFWVRPSVKFLPDIIQSNQIEAVITTGPPHSLHLIGRKLKKKTGVTWLADFRDPWTEWDLYETFPMTLPARKWQKKLERKVLQEADRVLTINNYCSRRFQILGGRHVKVITNGYDEADFKNFNKRRTGMFTIRHIGVLDEMRNPGAFITALEDFVARYPEEKILVEFIGNVADIYKEQINKNELLKKYVAFRPYQPHDEIIRSYEETDVLLLVLTTTKHAAGNIPGKLYEYLASGARILALGPTDGEVAGILDDTGAGTVIEHQAAGKIRKTLEKYFRDYQQGYRQTNKNVVRYSRRNQAAEVAGTLDRLSPDVSPG